MDWFNKTLQSRRSKTRLECVCCVTLLPYTSILLRRFTNEILHEAFRIVVRVGVWTRNKTLANPSRRRHATCLRARSTVTSPSALGRHRKQTAFFSGRSISIIT